MQDSDDRNVVGGYNEVNGIRKPANERATHLGFNHGELLGILGDTVEQAIECRHETLSQEALPFIPRHRVFHIVLGTGTQTNREAHDFGFD
jgi:hypothetical protein